jgi:hypothetical protein
MRIDDDGQQMSDVTERPYMRDCFEDERRRPSVIRP